MADFSQAVAVVFDHEGGYVDHPSDPGGATNYGISLRFLRQIERGDINRDGSVDGGDIRQIDEDIAGQIYHQHWWARYRYDRISDQDVATKLLDLAVNMGSRHAHRCIQRACRAAGYLLQVDGRIGPLSIEAINAADPFVLFAALCSEAAGRYRLLVALRESRRVFETGWLNRAYSGPWFRRPYLTPPDHRLVA